MGDRRRGPLTREEAGENARQAMDALALRATPGIPTLWLNVMDVAYLERKSGHPPGAYRVDPDGVYLDFQRAAGVGFIDQFIPENPGTIGSHGYEADTARGATTGAGTIALDGVTIDGPEAVAEHLERFEFPRLEAAIAAADPAAPEAVRSLIDRERKTQTLFGPDILKVPYGEGFQHFPILRYGQYGYEHYLTAYAIFPDLMERDFALQADLAVRRNAVAARAICEGGLPKVLRSDHDMAGSSGLLVDVRSLDRIWLPHFARSIQPLLDAGIRLLWHCDGNLMALVPRLIEAGIGGFQGFQYEDGMDYPRICAMTTRDGDPLMIWAGVSVTRTLPLGSPADVRHELDWLVEHGPGIGLILGVSSSVTPGVPWENLDALREGLAYYRAHGRRHATGAGM